MTSKPSNWFDLLAAREELKQFRHDVAILKKKGLLDKAIDARNILPTKYLKSQVKKYSSVIEGKAQTVKVSAAKKKYYKAKGYQTKGGRVIVPVQAGEKVYGTSGDFRIKIVGKGGSITRIDLGLSPDDILQWADDLRDNKYPVRSDELIRFQFFGNNSHAGFHNLPGKTAQQRMAEYLENYPTFERLAEHGSAKDMATVIQGITIFKVKRDPATGDWPKPDPHAEDKYDEEALRKYNERERRSRQIRLGKMSDEEYAQYKAERAENERRRRAAMAAEKKDAYKKKAKARAAKSRGNKSAK